MHRIVRYPHKEKVMSILQSVDNKEVNFNWALIQLIAGIIFAILHLADILEDKK